MEWGQDTIANDSFIILSYADQTHLQLTQLLGKQASEKWDGEGCGHWACMISIYHLSHLSPPSPCAATFPSFPVSGPFLPDVPGFRVHPDSIFPPQLRSSSRALPLHLHFNNCSDVFSFISSFDVPEPFQPSSSHNHRYRFHLCFFQDLLIYPVL